MSQYSKSNERLKKTAEFFTPKCLVDDMLNKLIEKSPEILTDVTKNSVDPTCGNGQFIIELIKRKHKAGMTKQQAIESTLGSDLMIDNICDIIARIVFWKEYDIDIFDERGEPIHELEYPGNHEDHSMYWLCEQVTENPEFEYIRRYTLKDEQGNIIDKVSVRPKKEQWWIIEYLRSNDPNKSYNGGYLNKNYIIADVLCYDFAFDGKQPEFSKEYIRKQQELQKEKTSHAQEQSNNKCVLM